jgi:predicted AAA+ superfamily ATPase
VPTIGEWLHVLEITSQIIVVPPYFENLGKRLVKTPKARCGPVGPVSDPVNDEPVTLSSIGAVPFWHFGLSAMREAS